MKGDFTVKRSPYDNLPAVPSFELKSNVIADRQTLPVPQRSGIFGAGGRDTSPDLQWVGSPHGTQSFIVTMYDPDAPTPSGFWHWTVIDIPGEVTSLRAGAGDSDNDLPRGAVHLANDAGLRRYLGAAPPPGDPHRYFVVVSALDIPKTGLATTTSPALAAFQTLAHTIGRAMLVPELGA
jgi:Raf kinase inhibitor-like YbhB/YbcL family protein